MSNHYKCFCSIYFNKEAFFGVTFRLFSSSLKGCQNAERFAFQHKAVQLNLETSEKIWDATWKPQSKEELSEAVSVLEKHPKAPGESIIKFAKISVGEIKDSYRLSNELKNSLLR